MRLRLRAIAAILLLPMLPSLSAIAEPWAAPGNMRLRTDLQLLNDTGVITLPLATWPVAWDAVHRALVDVEAAELSPSLFIVYERLRQQARDEAETRSLGFELKVNAAKNPHIIRTFEDTPREDGQLSAGVNWKGETFAFNLTVSGVDVPENEDTVRPDGSYAGFALGNWMLSAGWQERWWGPGWGGSLILSNNARPFPHIAIQRKSTDAFELRWLRWIGPWTLTSFMGQLDDEREIDDTLLFGLRVSFRPTRGLEIGLSRTAQWCGGDRPCDSDIFADLLLGNDNRGVNVAPENEPGNQLAAIDVRWSLPHQIPVAFYLQWTGEDTRKGGPELGSWLRQAGIEVWGGTGELQHRTHVEISDTTCQEGGAGSGGAKPNCAYEHSIYRTGYRYENRVIGHSSDGDGLSYSLGSTFVPQAGHYWNVLLRKVEINREGSSSARHTLSATPQDLLGIQLSHSRVTAIGRFDIGLGFSRLDDELTGEETDDVSAFLQWRLH